MLFLSNFIIAIPFLLCIIALKRNELPGGGFLVEKNYQRTIYACFVGYIVQAIVNNFVPLLFVTFSSLWNIPLSKITLLITFNFVVQLLVDLLSAGFVDRIGYRASILLAHAFSAVGLLSLAFLPSILPSAFAGLLISVCIYAIGGGLLEVLVSPIVEGCPTDNKEQAMSLLHSFYCWGHVGVVLLSTLFFHFFGLSNWRVLTCIWALIPIANGVLFSHAPVPTPVADGASGLTIKELFAQRIFWLLLLMMLCSGASEQAVSQWASTFAEKGLGVSKTIGDLAGPMAFAVLMGSARAFYGKCGSRINLDRFMLFSGFLCVVSYLLISLSPSPLLSLIGCGLCGLSVGIMWPGTFSKASARLQNGGTAMFALLALAGDLGCSGGPTLVGFVSGLSENGLRTGILAALVFPILLITGVFLLRTRKKASP